MAMETNEIDFTIFFDSLTRVAEGESDQIVLNLFGDTDTDTDTDAGIALMNQCGAQIEKTTIQ